MVNWPGLCPSMHARPRPTFVQANSTEGREGEEEGQTHVILLSKLLELGQHGLWQIDCRATCVINQALLHMYMYTPRFILLTSVCWCWQKLERILGLQEVLRLWMWPPPWTQTSAGRGTWTLSWEGTICPATSMRNTRGRQRQESDNVAEHFNIDHGEVKWCKV